MKLSQQTYHCTNFHLLQRWQSNFADMADCEVVVIHDVDVRQTIVLAHPYFLHHEAEFQDIKYDNVGRVRIQAPQYRHPAVIFR